MKKLLPILLLLVCSGLSAPHSSLAVTLNLPPATASILDHIYSGQNELAVTESKALQREQPESPLGYLLEAEARWWEMWCASAEYKYGMTMARHRDKSPADLPYLELAAKSYSLAETSLQQHESAEMRLYAGMADALAARIYGLRGEGRATARAGVRARENLQRALTLDPTLDDAYLGLGLYNYYVDTLSTMARVLRFFMGIPGGSKQEGIRQLRQAMEHGTLTSANARFYLAISLHNYDQKYESALEVISPLVEKYPENALFRMARGDLYGKVGRKALAIADYRAALASTTLSEACRRKMDELARQARSAQEAETPRASR